MDQPVPPIRNERKPFIGEEKGNLREKLGEEQGNLRQNQGKEQGNFQCGPECQRQIQGQRRQNECSNESCGDKRVDQDLNRGQNR